MADILIKGIGMPTFCLCCPCLDVDYGECIPKENRHIETEEYLSNRRPDWCPLVEVPAHGELVDRDKLLAEMADEIIRRGGDEQSIGIAWAQSAVEFATTVLEASEEEQDG